MAKKNQCEWYDYINDKPSKLHKELIGKEGRPEGNLLYATYKTSDIPEKMDAAGYKRNSQNQHSAQDMLEFLDWTNVNNESLGKAERAIGAKDASDNLINYTDAQEALQKADELNDTRKHLVANVYKHGDVYNIIVSERNSRTFKQPDNVKEKLKLYDFYKQAFSSVGIDITTVPDSIKHNFSAFNDQLIAKLQNIKRSEFRHMDKDYAAMIFFLNASSEHTQRVINMFGSIDEAAKAVYDINRGVMFPSNQQRLLMRAIDNGKNFSMLDLDAMQREASDISSQVKATSPTESIEQELHRLNKKYHIDFNESHRIDEEIHTLSEAAMEAVMNVERQLRQLEKQEGKNEEGRRLSWIKEQLLKELANQKYYSGIMNYLSEASRQLNFNPDTGTSIVDDILREAEDHTGTDLEKVMAKIKALSKIQRLHTIYYPLVEALSNENITIDESIRQEDIDNIRNTSKALKDLFDKQKGKIKERTLENMEDLLIEVIGDELPNGISIHNALRMSAVDSSLWDYLYSMGRVSNPIVNAMGTIIRKAQENRDSIINGWDLRTRRATNKLYESGSNSEFMYEDDGHIASPYDWNAFRKAKSEYAKQLRRQNTDEWTIDQLLEDWTENNTIEVVVDEKSGRTERVPNEQYRKQTDFQEGWTQAQKDYYKEMMQIKGEIGTLLPAYAQKQFLPPQVRRNTLDALGHAQSIKDVTKALKNKVKDIWTVREDDTEFADRGIIVDGQEKVVVESDFDNTRLRQIPIFFINRVEKGELLKDFSGALSHLAGTAINYSAMSEIADVVEFVGDFAKSQTARSKNAEVDVVGNRFYKIIADVFKIGKNSNTENIVNAFIMQHIYGQKLDPEQKWYEYAKPVLSLLGYTSFKGLATNVVGAFSNYLVGEFQMLIEAGAGEFYGFKNYLNAHKKLFGGTGVPGEIADLLTNNMNHRATLFREKFDPINENFSDKSNKRFYKSAFRQLVGHDCAFIGYGTGEYLIHYVNMYAVLDNIKVLHNGKKISLMDAYEVTEKIDGNSELKLKDGVTTLDGKEIIPEWELEVRNRIRYCNQTCHGSMNEEDKGAWTQNLIGRAANQFRQWMWEHYSRRFRMPHLDESLGELREGYWVSWYKLVVSDEVKDKWNSEENKWKNRAKAIAEFMKDYIIFVLRGQAQWDNLSETQRYNVRRVHSEMIMYIALCGLSMTLGEPDKHKRDFWRRWWIYQTKRLITETEASMPNPWAIKSGLTILQSPLPAVNTMNSFTYTFYGLFNGDLIGPNSEIKSGRHKGENRYWRNFQKYNLPAFKDLERLETMAEDESIFQVFKDTPSNR